jgi:hypothetical protein
MVSGGNRPGAPQNNPANVSAMGGNGQSGKIRAQDYTGFPYGQNGALEEQGKAAPTEAPTSPGFTMPSQTKDMSLYSESLRTDEPISAGVDGNTPGVGSDALPREFRQNTSPIENEEIVMRYLPDLVEATKIKGVPDSYKGFVNYLIGKLS